MQIKICDFCRKIPSDLERYELNEFRYNARDLMMKGNLLDYVIGKEREILVCRECFDAFLEKVRT